MSDGVERVVTQYVDNEKTANCIAVKRTERVQQVAVRRNIDHRLTTARQYLYTQRETDRLVQ